MTLSADEKQSIINYRIEKAHSTLEEARIVMDKGLWNLAVNRFYYCISYAASALLLSKGISASSHAGVLRMLQLHFVKRDP